MQVDNPAETNAPTTPPIAGYTFGTDVVPPSPVSMAELQLLKQAVQLGPDDERWLHLAGEVLADQAEALVDHWRGIIAAHPYLAAYSAGTDGQPNPAYGAASRPRFVQWVRDVCQRTYDQAWLDYQHEIGLRHTRAKKNQTDAVESASHIPLRYVLAFGAAIMATTRPFLGRKGHSPDEIDRMHAAWNKAVMLHLTLWSRAYVGPENW